MDAHPKQQDSFESLFDSSTSFRLLSENVADCAIFLLDTDGCVATWNSGAERLKQYTADDIIGKNFSVFYMPDEVAAGKPAADLERALHDRRAEYQGWLRRKDGSLFRAHAVITPVYDSNGKHLGFGKVTRNISRELSLEQMHSVLDHVPDGVISTDDLDVIQTFNLAAEEIFGYSQAEVIGQNVSILMPESLPGVQDGYLGRRLRPGSNRRVDVSRQTTGRRRDGTTFPMELAISSFELDGRKLFTGIMRDVSERVNEEVRMRAILDHASDSIITVDDQGLVLTLNRAAERNFGYEESEMVGEPVYLLAPEDERPSRQSMVERMCRGEQDQALSIEATGLRKDGTTFPMEISFSEFSLAERHYVIGISHDTTQRKKLEDQLRQGQKMEAIGRLAGGVAHDFNNLLTVIIGYSQMAISKLPPTGELQEFATEILRAGERAALITQQLLAFSRQLVLAPRVLDLNAVVVETEKMLRRLIGEDISIVTTLEPELCHIRVDQGQIVQVIMNLTVNARDAMPQGGKLSIKTSNFYVDEERSRLMSDCQPGQHVLLSVSDNGIGMTREVRERIFEPFFTTKRLGEGTGLGLPTVYGIIAQSGGRIDVYSEPGAGTTFLIYFPAIDDQESERQQIEAAESCSGSETILIVEDDDAVRKVAVVVLEEQGYTVLVAGGGPAALEIARGHKGPIDLLLTDLVMPELSGRQVAESIQPLLPGVKVLYMSGYTDDAVVRHGLISGSFAFLQKPFTSVSLGSKVREVLDAKAQREAEANNPDSRPGSSAGSGATAAGARG